MIEIDTESVEAHVRTVLRAVADATTVHAADAVPTYVRSRSRRRLGPSIMMAACAAAFLGAVVLVSELRDAPPPTVDPLAAPEGGRLLVAGKTGSKAWALYGADNLKETKGTPCVTLVVEGARKATNLCNLEALQQGSSITYMKTVLGTADRNVLLIVFVTSEVERLALRTSLQEVPLVVDPAHPSGIRFAVLEAPSASGRFDLTAILRDGMIKPATLMWGPPPKDAPPGYMYP